MQRKNLDEVSFIRPILIVLLVLYHAFAPWGGTWTQIEGIQNIRSYWWLAKYANSFMLPTFVFLSGYVWSFQRENLRKFDSFKELLIKKIKRLIIPSSIFSIAYIIIFGKHYQGSFELISDVFSGTAHMWFLPMLFECFFIGWIILQVRNRIIRLLILLLLFLLGIIDVPLRINVTFYYIMFFMLGYEIQIRAELIRLRNKKEWIILLWAVHFFSFIIFQYIIENYCVVNNLDSITKKLMIHEGTSILKLIYSTFGVFAFYLTALKVVSHYKLSHKYVHIGQYCFGVYLFQQFILVGLYYHSKLPTFFNEFLLPWIAFIIALFGSILMSYFMRFTRIGRKLL